MKFHIYGQQRLMDLPEGATVQDLKTLAYFNKVIMCYLKMCRLR